MRRTLIVWTALTLVSALLAYSGIMGRLLSFDVSYASITRCYGFTSYDYTYVVDGKSYIVTAVPRGPFDYVDVGSYVEVCHNRLFPRWTVRRSAWFVVTDGSQPWLLNGLCRATLGLPLLFAIVLFRSMMNRRQFATNHSPTTSFQSLSHDQSLS